MYISRTDHEDKDIGKKGRGGVNTMGDFNSTVREGPTNKVVGSFGLSRRNAGNQIW